MVNIFILIVGIIGFLILLTFLVKKSIKKIGQKIYISYNQIYRKFINFYYDTSIKKQLLKEELTSYYVDVISSKEPDKYFKKYEEFLSKILGKSVSNELEKLNLLQDDLNLLKKLYNWIIILILLIVVTSLLFILLYKI